MKRFLSDCLLIALMFGFVGAARATPVIMVYGDSLSAEYGLSRGAGWAALLEERLKQGKKDYSVVNASISGETTAGGASRIATTRQFQGQHHVFKRIEVRHQLE